MRRKQTMSVKPVKFKECYERFLAEKSASGLSERTLEIYQLHLDHFFKLTDAENKIAANFDIDSWNYYLSEMKKDKRKKDVTANSYSRSVRVFLYWCMDKEYIPNANLKLPRYRKKVKEVYTSEEIMALLEPPAPGCSEVFYQTWVFINLIMATGLRLSSALNLKVSDYIKKEQLLYVQETKQKVGQKLYLNSEVCNILNKYIKEFRLELDDYIFCTGNRTLMARRTMEENVSTFNASRGVFKTSIHLMRHTFAKNYYSNSPDVYGLQQILGHSQISTTEQYLRGLGVTHAVTSVYNPQRQFMQLQDDKIRRRSRVKR